MILKLRIFRFYRGGICSMGFNHVGLSHAATEFNNYRKMKFKKILFSAHLQNVPGSHVQIPTTDE